MMRPSANGPRSLIRTSVFCPVRLLVTSTTVLSGRRPMSRSMRGFVQWFSAGRVFSGGSVIY